nr:MAG TPA: hypothetical protein [Caudoviricetes sp.]
MNQCLGLIRSVCNVHCLRLFRKIFATQQWVIALNVVTIAMAKTMRVILLSCIRGVIYE